MRTNIIRSASVVVLAAGCCLAFAGFARAQAPPQPAGPAGGDSNDAMWSVTLEGFFPGASKRGGEPKRLNAYLVRRAGKWVHGLGTATIDGRPVWNTAAMPIDPAGLTVEKGKLTGTMGVTLVPDPWIPKDQKQRQATVTLDCAVAAGPGDAKAEGRFATVTGAWKATIPGEEAELRAAGLAGSAEGRAFGGVGPQKPTDVDDASYDLLLYNLVPGNSAENFQRRRALSLGVKDARVVSARLGQVDIRNAAYDYEILESPETAQVTGDAVSASVAFSADTLDGSRAEFFLTLAGRRVHNFVAGTWKGTYAAGEGKPQEISGFFRGDVRKGAFVGAAAKDDRPWFVAAKGFKPLQPGEHPRLFFRKDDLPELRRRAATPDGQVVVKRLRQLLNGSDGESMPASFNPAKLAYEKNNFKPQAGAYSISHAAGFGFLYQLTGDQKYAGFARQCVEKGWDGQRDFDDRYAWVAPGGELRAGPSLGWTAVAYDLCYDAWPVEFRARCARMIQDYSDVRGGEWNNPEGITLRKMVLTPKQGPGSNHYGAVVGGSGLAVLAVKDDPGTDKPLLEKYAQVIDRQVVRHLSAGWGDGGYYKEGWGASQVGTQGGFLCLLQALKTAAGHDYLNVDRPNASFVTMVPRALMLLGPPAVYPYRSNMGGTYGSFDWRRERAGFSHGGHFAEGFGAIADKYKPGFLWVFNHTVEPDPAARDFDTPSLYPHRAMLALINWPTFAGVAEQNPAAAMPKVTRDRLYEYFVFRNRWQDADDVVTTVLINTPQGTRPRDVMAWGLGQRLTLGEPPPGAPVTYFQPARDGSGTLTAGDWAMAVDYSRASGADALVVTAAKEARGADKSVEKSAGKAKGTTIAVGGTTMNVLTLCASGKHPEPKAGGAKLIVGGQTLTWSQGRLTLGTFDRADAREGGAGAE